MFNKNFQRLWATIWTQIFIARYVCLHGSIIWHFNALLHMVPNTKYTFLSLITGKPRYSKSKQTLGFERELVNKKVSSILYSHVFRCSLDWFSVRYVCIITSKTMIKYYGSIYIELTVGFSFSFLLILVFWGVFLDCIYANEAMDLHQSIGMKRILA